MLQTNICVLGPIATALSNTFSVRSVMMVGGILLGLGLVISAFTPSTEFMFFSYSLIAGKQLNVYNFTL